MKPDLNRLEKLYFEYFQLVESGKDVVYEIDKEINNLELMALQDSIIPGLAQYVASELKRLKCTVEISIQYNGKGSVKYGFGKSGSMTFVEGVAEASNIHKTLNNIDKPIEINSNKTSIIKPNTGYPDVDKYICLFSMMKTAIRKGIRHPAKAILLITILRGVESKQITSSGKVYLNSMTMTAYNNTWAEFVPKSWPFDCNICQPYIHLSSEEFYDLDLKKPIPYMGAAWKVPSVKRYVNFATIDDDLYILATSIHKREILIKFLMDYFNLKGSEQIENLSASDGLYKFNNTNNSCPSKEGEPTMLEFKKFLSAYSSPATGRKLSPSSVNVYASALYGDFLKRIIKDISGTENIFKVNDLEMLNLIYEEVRKKRASSGNNCPKQTIKHYIEFWRLWNNNIKFN